MRREIADLVFYHIVLLQDKIQLPFDLFTWSVTGRCLRATDDLKLVVLFARTDVIKYLYFIRVSRLWVSLPYIVRCVESLLSFKTELFKFTMIFFILNLIFSLYTY